ncbi:MAG: RNA methyltransferase [Candidatus Omnitrophota bacterium]
MRGIPFVVVLTRTQHPENAGFAARSMKAFGFDALRFAAPSFVLDERSPAYKTASGAREILDGAQVYSTLVEALADCHTIVGFSRRRHDFKRPQLDVPSWMEEMKSAPPAGKMALVFGPEDFGLSNEEKRLCEKVVEIPLHSERLSLNLSHAVTVVLYELSMVFTRISKQADDETETPAHQADVNRIVDGMAALLQETNFFKAGRRGRRIEIIRCLVQRLKLTSAEYETAMGIIQALRRRGQE